MQGLVQIVEEYYENNRKNGKLCGPRGHDLISTAKPNIHGKKYVRYLVRSVCVL